MMKSLARAVDSAVAWRAVADRIRPKVPKLAAILDDAEPDVLAYMTFPKEHRAKHSTDVSTRSLCAGDLVAKRGASAR
jgi:transposase-like protein